MLGILKSWFGDKGPLAHRVPLDWFEAQLAQDLLDTRFHWVWESARGFAAPYSKLPETRALTVLSAETAVELGADVGEYHLETHREITAFATASALELNAEQMREAVRRFAKTGEGPLVSILYQPPLGSAEVFAARRPQAELARLLGVWAERLGKPLEQVAGGATLRRMFLKSEAITGLPGAATSKG